MKNRGNKVIGINGGRRQIEKFDQNSEYKKFRESSEKIEQT